MNVRADERRPGIEIMVAAFACAVCSATALAGDDGEAIGAFAFHYPQPGESASPPNDPPPSVPAPAFGTAGSRWWTIGADLSHGFNGSTDSAIHGSYSYFLAQDIEFAAELGLWYFNQTGDNAAGASASMVFRWHFVNTGPWTVYTDAGIGVLGATDEVPDGGTSFDLMPRAGVGFTRLLSDDGVRLQVGVRWHHVSNARIFGDSNNPARDQPLIYAGIIFPF